MEGIQDFGRLIDFVAGRAHIDPEFREEMNKVTRLSPETMAVKLKTIAEQMGIDPEVVDNFDLGSIETDSFQGFLGEIYFRYFRDDSIGPER